LNNALAGSRERGKEESIIEKGGAGMTLTSIGFFHWIKGMITAEREERGYAPAKRQRRRGENTRGQKLKTDLVGEGENTMKEERTMKKSTQRKWGPAGSSTGTGKSRGEMKGGKAKNPEKGRAKRRRISPFGKKVKVGKESELARRKEG